MKNEDINPKIQTFLNIGVNIICVINTINSGMGKTPHPSPPLPPIKLLGIC